MQRLYATCIALGELGLLITGPSGSGKSDLALRLIERGANLVADDQVEIDDLLMARCPAAITGLIEVRGVGILRAPTQPMARVCALLEPAPPTELDRIPEPMTLQLHGYDLPLLRLPYLQPSSPLKVKMWLEQCVNPANVAQQVGAQT